MKNKIDHIVVGADNLDRGVGFLHDALSVEVPRGGKHPTMGTHNCVMQTGNETFLEVISIDPDAEAPGRPRWFTLDDTRTKRRLSERPRPLCWVVGTDDLDAVVGASPVHLGDILHFQRGERTWRMAIPADGHLLGDGLIPVFIEWSPGPHPSTNQKDLGVRLRKVVLSTPEPDQLRALLSKLAIEHLAEVREGNAGLSFELDTPKGIVEII